MLYMFCTESKKSNIEISIEETKSTTTATEQCELKVEGKTIEELSSKQ